MPQPNSLHVDSILTNLSVKYRNEEMIWPHLMPVIKVNKRSDLYWVYDKADSYKLVDDMTSPKADANEADWGVSDDNYSVKGHALGDYLPQESIDNADVPLQPEMDTNEFLNNLLDVAQESRVVNILFNPLTYSAANLQTLVGDAQWDNGNGNPITDIQDAIESCFMRANVLTFGLDTWKVLRSHPMILDAVKSSTRYQGTGGGGMAQASEVAALFEVKQVLIGRGRYITTKPGQTAQYARLWGKHAAATYVNPSVPGLKTLTFGATISESLRVTYRGFDEKKGEKGAHYFKVAWNSDEKVIAADCGAMIQNAVA